MAALMLVGAGPESIAKEQIEPLMPEPAVVLEAQTEAEADVAAEGGGEAEATPEETILALPEDMADIAADDALAAENMHTVIQDPRHPDNMFSLLFTYWERQAIMDARKPKVVTRPTTPAEVQQEMNKKQEEAPKQPPPPESRVIRLGGILYVSDSDWTIWLNEQRVTPTAIPQEVLDINVEEDYVELRWFDDYLGRVIPIRMRPHQRFNIDMRVFLPG